MTTVNFPAFARPPIDAMRFARNNYFPEAGYITRLQEETNQIVGYRVKSWSFAGPCGSIPATDPAQRTRWRCFLHTSSHHSYMWVRFVVASSGVTTNPFVRADFVRSGGSSDGSADFYFGNNSAAVNDTPAYFGIGNVTTDGSGTLAELVADTDYELTLSDIQGARLVAACVYEIAKTPDTSNGYIEAGLQAGSPIYDAHRAAVVPALRTAWKRNGAPLITWSSNTDAAAPTNATATDKNIIDANTTVSSATPGFTLDLTHRSTVRRASSGVPCVMRVYGLKSVNNGLVKLKDSGGTTLATATVTSTTGSWVSSGAFYLPATQAKYDITHSNSSGSVTTYAVSVMQYET